MLKKKKKLVFFYEKSSGWYTHYGATYKLFFSMDSCTHILPKPRLGVT